MAYLERSIEEADDKNSPFEGKGKEGAFPSSDADSWHARTYHHYSGLEAVWRRMEAEGHCTIFQTYDWASCWYDNAISSGEAEAVIVTVSRGEGEKPEWILPLCLYRKGKTRIISFADLGISDYAAPITARGAPSDRKAVEDIMRAVLDELPPCDIVNFQKIGDTIDGVSNPLMHLPCLERFPVNCHGIYLSKPWPELKSEIMQRCLHRTIRGKKKQLYAQHDVAIEHHDATSDALPALMGMLMEIRRERFEAIGRPDMPEMWKNFYKNLATRKGQTIQPSISVLKISGEAVACCFGLEKGDGFHALLASFRMGKWASFRPGMLLFDEMLTGFSERTKKEGYFDFTIGDEVYKKRFGCESKPLYEWMVVRSIHGLPFYMLWRIKLFFRRHPALMIKTKSLLSKLPFLKDDLKDQWKAEG